VLFSIHLRCRASSTLGRKDTAITALQHNISQSASHSLLRRLGGPSPDQRNSRRTHEDMTSNSPMAVINAVTSALAVESSIVASQAPEPLLPAMPTTRQQQPRKQSVVTRILTDRALSASRGCVFGNTMSPRRMFKGIMLKIIDDTLSVCQLMPV
jgi:hypothetical protein